MEEIGVSSIFVKPLPYRDAQTRMYRVIEDILVGAITPGVNKATVYAVNAALVVCGVLFGFALAGIASPEVVPHLIVVLVLTFGLFISFNWLISEIGVVRAREQPSFFTETTSKKQGSETKKE